MATQLGSQLVNRLRIRQLALLVALADQRTLHRAAAHIHLSQPSATKMVHDLETLFGFPLFERLPRGMQATEMGQIVIQFAERILADLDRFASDIEDRSAGGYGGLRIGAIVGAAPDFVARAIADIKARRPRLMVTVSGETSDQILGLLTARKIDLAVGRFNDLAQHNEINFESLGGEAVVMVARSGHPLATAEDLQLSALADAAWILQPLGNPTRQLLEREFGQAAMKTPPNVVECTSIFAILQLLQKSDAVALLTEPVVRDHLQAGLLVELPLPVAAKLPSFGILTRRDEPIGGAEHEFIDCLRQYA